ncbi:hypothetical protein T08_15492 [Trichinella sp. T8]|nr:hypothetical protein T08_15492 [Trichinella sp. T8]
MQIFIPLLYVGLRGFSFNGCWRTVYVHLKTQEWKMDVNDRKTAISLREWIKQKNRNSDDT